MWNCPLQQITLLPVSFKTMSSSNVQWLVVTDLDGTLLNHDSYSFDAAKNAIVRLQKKNIPVILNTSKTYAETVTILQTLGINDPFIVENGSCIYLPKNRFDKPPGATSREDYWALLIGVEHNRIDAILQNIKTAEKNYLRLSSCSVEQAVALTGLSKEQAAQAIAREFSEPLIWQADETALYEFQQQLKLNALTTLQGGRFLHVIGNCDKGEAMARLIRCYKGKVKTIVLGDSANDAAMLALADISVIVNSPSNHQLRKLVSADIQTAAVAPEGWQEAINQVLMQIN